MQKNVLEYFENTLLVHRNKTAIIDQDKVLTFGEWEQAAKRLCMAIREKSAAIRKPIGVYLPKSADSLVSFMAILYSGNIYVPLDIKSPAGRTQSMMENLHHPLVITSAEYLEELAACGVERGNIIDITEAYAETRTFDPAEVLTYAAGVIDTDPIYVIYTSGSTGIPKGVVVCHRGVIDYIDWAVECFAVTSEEVIGSQSPFYFDNSTLDIYLCLATGATLNLIPEQHFAFPKTLMDYVVEQKINFVFWVPSVMISVANLRALEGMDLSGLKKVLFAGEVMPNRHLNYWRSHMPGSLFANLYGPTEITVDCTYYIVTKEFADDDKLPIGFPCRNTDILILNEDNQPAKVDELGELCVRGSSLALGYWNNPEKSDSVFTQNPCNPDYFDRIYRTGDFVYLNEEGEIIFMGRKDAQIKHMGYRIELGEIETALLSLEGIHNSCVLYNKPKQEITMFYTGDDEVTKAVIRKKLVPLLPKYMIPTKIYKLDQLPMNQNGKIDRPRLVREYLEEN
ncbi:MAG: amino acid adenylation domain-containing protein [Syntrophomonadaceae bacterium]|nr:amino acid adenylation domain-containing protein [Syntrophomonadaceae bacterium]